jgi:hypothetical protein
MASKALPPFFMIAIPIAEASCRAETTIAVWETKPVCAVILKDINKIKIIFFMFRAYYF